MSTQQQLDSVSMVVIATRPQALAPATQFLAKRGWRIEVVSDLRSAIAQISTLKAQWALVSLNHPSLNVKKTAALLAQTFSVTTIGFVEDFSNSNMHAGFEGPILPGKVSGPAIQVKVQVILRNMENAAAENGNRPQLTSSDSINSGEDTIQVRSSGDLSRGGNDVIIQKGARGDAHAVMTSSTQGSDLSSSSSQAKGGGEGVMNDSQNLSTLGGGAGLGSPASNPLITPPADSTGAARSAATASPSSNPSAVARTQKAALPSFSQPPKANASAEQQKMFQTIGAALAQLAPPSGETAERLREVATVELTIIESFQPLGYLLVASTPGQRQDGKVARFVQQCVRQSFAPKMAQNEMGPSGALDIHFADFIEWSQATAAFVQAFLLGNGEVAVAFIDAQTLPRYLPEVLNEPTVQKAQIQVRDVPIEQTLPVELFVYLPENDRFVRLVKEGGYLTDKQSERLAEQKTHGLFIDKKDIERFKIFFARNCLLTLMTPPESSDKRASGE